MKKKGVYLNPENGKINRTNFREDLKREARDRNLPISEVLFEFFSQEKFTKEEMGKLALNSSSHGNLIEGTIVLLHALKVEAGTVAELKILEDYIGLSITDPLIWTSSWTIDSMMNWPMGTILPISRNQLQRI